MGKNKIDFFFSLDHTQFTWSRNLNNQTKETFVVKKIPMKFMRFLYMPLKVCEACEVIGPAFFEETNTKRYIKLIPTIIFK